MVSKHKSDHEISWVLRLRRFSWSPIKMPLWNDIGWEWQSQQSNNRHKAIRQVWESAQRVLWCWRTVWRRTKWQSWWIAMYRAMRILAFPHSSCSGRGRLIGPEQSISVMLGPVVLASLWTPFTAAEQRLELTKRTKVSGDDVKLLGLRRIVRPERRTSRRPKRDAQETRDSSRLRAFILPNPSRSNVVHWQKFCLPWKKASQFH